MRRNKKIINSILTKGIILFGILVFVFGFVFDMFNLNKQKDEISNNNETNEIIGTIQKAKDQDSYVLLSDGEVQTGEIYVEPTYKNIDYSYSVNTDGTNTITITGFIPGTNTTCHNGYGAYMHSYGKFAVKIPEKINENSTTIAYPDLCYAV